MRILFDNGTPAPLRRHLEGHTVDLASERGWAQIANGNLLRLAEQEGYEVLISNDKDFIERNNHTSDTVRIIVVQRFNWPISLNGINAIREAILRVGAGERELLRL